MAVVGWFTMGFGWGEEEDVLDSVFPCGILGSGLVVERLGWGRDFSPIAWKVALRLIRRPALNNLPIYVGTVKHSSNRCSINL